jgi:hypothetical protein
MTSDQGAEEESSKFRRLLNRANYVQCY